MRLQRIVASHNLYVAGFSARQRTASVAHVGLSSRCPERTLRPLKLGRSTRVRRRDPEAYLADVEGAV